MLLSNLKKSYEPLLNTNSGLPDTLMVISKLTASSSSADVENAVTTPLNTHLAPSVTGNLIANDSTVLSSYALYAAACPGSDGLKKT